MEDLLQVEIANLDQELSKLKSAVEYIETAKISIESASKIINTITKLKEEFGKLSEKAYLVIDKFDKMEIPSRLDNINSKMDSKVVSINSEIQTLQTRIEASNKAVLIEMKTMSRNMSSDLNDNEIKIFTRLESQSKAIKLIQYGLIGIFSLIVIVGVFVFLSSH
jgi:DNA-directed RNA polymerase beta' subunit